MRKIRRFLLMAAQGGIRYLRAVLKAVVGLKAQATTAPGAPMTADLEAESPKIKAEGVSRPVADGRFQGTVLSVRMMAEMVAKLVSDAVFRGRTLLDNLTADISTAPAADMEGSFRAEVTMTADMEAAPGAPIELDAVTSMDLTAEAEAAPPTPMEAYLMPHTQLNATPTPGSPTAIFANFAAQSPELTANIAPGSPADGMGRFTMDAQLSARMSTWRDPTRNGTTLHIPQVYDYQQDGSTLKIL